MGNSNYEYGTNGKVIKEIERITNGSEDINVEYDYSYNASGNLISVILQNKSIPNAFKDKVQPDRTYEYNSNGTIKVISSYQEKSAEIALTKTEYNYKSNVLAEVKFYTFNYASVQNFETNITSSASLSTSTISKSYDLNYLAAVFKTLDFIPYRVNPYIFDASYISFTPNIDNSYSDKQDKFYVYELSPQKELLKIQWKAFLFNGNDHELGNFQFVFHYN